MGSTILLADAHRMCREGIRLLLAKRGDLEIVEAGDGEEALRLVSELPVDVAVLETALPKRTGIDVIEVIRKEHQRTRCIALTTTRRRREVEQAMRTGAAGCVVKSDSIEELIEAIDVVRSGKYYFSPSITQHLVDAIASPAASPGDGISLLTNRERQVLQQIAEGRTSKEIAAELGVSTKTVDSHRSRLMQKLDIHKASALVRFAIEEGLVPV